MVGIVRRWVYQRDEMARVTLGELEGAVLVSNARSASSLSLCFSHLLLWSNGGYFIHTRCYSCFLDVYVRSTRSTKFLINTLFLFVSLTRLAGTDITDLSSMLHTVHFTTTAYRQCQPGESRFTRCSHVLGSRGSNHPCPTTHAFFNSRSGIPAHPKRSALSKLISIQPANENRKSKHQGKRDRTEGERNVPGSFNIAPLSAGINAPLGG